MADIKIKRTDSTGKETTVEVTGLEYGASDFMKDVLDRLGHTEAENPLHGMEALPSNHELDYPTPYNMRAVRPRHITPNVLKEAIEKGRLDGIIKPFDEIDIPLDTGRALTAVCGYSDSRSARFVFQDRWDEAVMNDEATNQGGYFKSKARAHVLVDILPHIAQEWRAIFKPRQIAEVIDGKKVEYADLLWLLSATDLLGPSENGYRKDIDDSFQLEIFKRERDRVKECADNGTCSYRLCSAHATNAAFFRLVTTVGDSANYSYWLTLGFDI